MKRIIQFTYLDERFLCMNENNHAERQRDNEKGGARQKHANIDMEP